MKIKKCTGICGLDKPLSEFNKEFKNKDGLKYWCKKCTKQYEKEYREKYPWKQILVNIKQRCENPNNKKYKNYGLRGIKNYLTEEDVKFLYIRDKAHLMDKPSIDREDNNGHYIFDNCQFIEWSENSIKDKRKPILQYNLNGNFIKEFISISEASRQLKIYHRYISQVLRGKQKTVKGFIWRYKNV